MEKNFIRVRSIKDIIITLTLIVTGAVMVALPTAESVNICGFFMIFAGILLGLIMKTGYKDEATGIRYSKVERFFEGCKREMLAKAIAGNCSKMDLSDEDKGNAVRIDIYHNNKAGKAYLQLFEYIPYKYEPCTDMYEHEIDNVTELIGK